MIFITSLRKITLNKQFIIITLIYLRAVQKVREQSCFGHFKWVLYQNGCHKIPNHIRVDLNVFQKSNLNWNDRGRGNYAWPSVKIVQSS